MRVAGSRVTDIPRDEWLQSVVECFHIDRWPAGRRPARTKRRASWPGRAAAAEPRTSYLVSEVCGAQA